MKKRKRILCLLLALFTLTAYCPAVQAQENVEEAEETEEQKERTAAPYFYVETDDPSVDRLPLKSTQVKVNISGIIADTYVVQTYANEGQNPISASYIFPASTKVTIHGMKMQVGNQIVTAVIQEKEEAREEYETAKSEGKTASLMEEKEANVFSMDVSNIMPGDIVSIELHYTEMIAPEEGSYQFVFPSVVGPRYVSHVLDDSGSRKEWTSVPYLPEGSAPTDTYAIEVNLAAGVPIAALDSSSHEIQIDWNEDRTNAAVSLANPDDYAGNRDFILDYCLQGEEMCSGLLLDTDGKENFFMLTLQPPKRVETDKLPAMEYVFVLDVSGSMYGYPLNTAKELIRNLVNGLSEADTFNLVLFANESARLSQASLPATEENVDKAIKLIDSQEGGGGTELGPALEEALSIPTDKEERSRCVVVITDGFVYNRDEIFDLIEKNAGEADFFSFGIGSSVNRHLIEGIAESGQGEPFVVTEEEQAAEVAERFRTYITSPVLTNIQVSFDGFEAYDVEPAALPTLFAQKPIILMGKYKGEASGTVTLTGQTADGSYTNTLDLSEAATSAEQGVLPYLWARKRVARLTDYGTNDEDPEVKEEVTSLGLNYSMLTPYTSFIAVLDVVRNPEGESTDVEQAIPLPLNVSNLSVGYTIGSEPEGMLLAMLMAAMVIGYAGKRFRRPAKNKRSL